MKRQNGQSVRELFLQLLRTRMALRRALQRTLRKNDAGISFEMLQVINRHSWNTETGFQFSAALT